jgi:GT2 family glycosyltransferase
MQIIIVIVNYKTANLLLKCLDSLRKYLLTHNVKIVISDNNSPDDSVSIINNYITKEKLGRNIKLLVLPKNGGFSSGNNEAIKYSLKNYPKSNIFWLLNPDTIVNSCPLELIAEYFKKDSKIGILGTKQTSMSTGASVSSAFNMFTPFGEFLIGAKFGPLFRLFPKFMVPFPPPDKAKQCDWVSGASFFVNKSLIDDIGLMDENFFLYFEEVDFCFRAKKNQWQVWFDPAVSIAHEDESSTGVGKIATRRPLFWYNSRRYFYRKHYGLFGLIVADLGWFLGRLTLLARHHLKLRSDVSKDPKHYMSDLILGDLKAIFNFRWKNKNES